MLDYLFGSGFYLHPLPDRVVTGGVKSRPATLCHHKALEPAGLCRLCTVRVSKGSWSRFVTSCNYPVWEGMEVETASEEV
ncbi:MAG: (2Fe-2S)-binding protein, partial [Deltaproteobacteria bacterium]